MQASAADPRAACKPLVGPLQGYYRVAYSRYRAFFSVEEGKIVTGTVLLRIKVLVLAVEIRKEHDKKDVYQVVKRLVELGLLPALQEDDEDL